MFFGALHLGAMGLHVSGAGWFAGTGIALACIDALAMIYLAAALFPDSALDDEAGDRHVIFVDGECIACNRLVRFILELDRRHLFRFAHLQGDFARAARVRHGADPDDVDSIYLLVHEGTERERLLLDGAAGREIWPRLFATAMPARLMPVPLLDIGYRAFARIRYRLFGKADACVVPPASLRARFVEAQIERS